MHIGEKIQFLREKEELSQRKLAKSMYVSRQTVSRWENGYSLPESESVILLAKTFGYPIEWFLKDAYGVDYLTSRPSEKLNESPNTDADLVASEQGGKQSKSVLKKLFRPLHK
ncbi:helix-turn-helix transcriptional regulator [Alkalibacterium indicireducens]|uniref:HTH cro/C1-type domain-containing protein n=1 Tax=Alkalibacterium indicireducens TaxID=398758 RepID=A0ABN1AKN4_9LACT